MSLHNISFYQTKKEDKKTTLRFYKAQGYSASFMGYDYTYWVKQDDNIVGSVIFSYINKNNTCALLHALYIDPNYRFNNLATHLIDYAANIHNHMICFADISLDMFYKKSSFIESPQNNLPECFNNKFIAYQQRNKKLKVYERIQ